MQITSSPTRKPVGPPGPVSCRSDSDCLKSNSICDLALSPPACRCRDGFFQLSGNCLSLNECADPSRNNCHVNADCTDLDVGYTCACKDGYHDAPGSVAPGTKCAETDECLLGVDNCDPTNEVCINLRPPAKWNCVPKTPAPTPAPTPATAPAPTTNAPTPIQGYRTVGLSVACTFLRISVNLCETNQYVYVSTGIAGTIPSEIGLLTALTYLVIYSLGVTGSIPPEIGNLINLQFLQIGFTSLTGAIPKEIEKLTKLSHLSFRDNSQMRGSIPTEIGNMDKVDTLRIHNNPQMTGPIPKEFGNLSNLKEVDLRSNGLTGVTPIELAQLNMLQYLGLSNNPLLTITPEIDSFCNTRQYCQK